VKLFILSMPKTRACIMAKIPSDTTLDPPRWVAFLGVNEFTKEVRFVAGSRFLENDIDNNLYVLSGRLIYFIIPTY
jgi:hypothetical protein